MGTSYYTDVFIGVKVTEFIKFEHICETWEVHDEKTGKPTGVKKSEEDFYLINKQNNKKIKLDKEKEYSGNNHNAKLYVDTIAYHIDVDCDPNEGDIGVEHLGPYYGTKNEEALEQYYIGTPLANLSTYNGPFIKEKTIEDIQEKIEKVKVFLKEKYNYKGKIYVVNSISWG